MIGIMFATAVLLQLLAEIAQATTAANLTNLAVGKTTYQRDVDYGGLSSYAVGGNYGPDMSVDKCTHTLASRAGNWWVVDLGGDYTVDRVTLTNKDEFVDRLADFYIRVGQVFNQASFDPATYTLCHYQSDDLCSAETRMFYCDQPIEGRYVTVHFPTTKRDVLTLCEVEVFEYVEELILHNRYRYYTGAPKGYQTVANISDTDSAVKCIQDCTKNKRCTAVKVTGQGQGQCTLLTGPYQCGSTNQITGVYMKKKTINETSDQ